MEAMLESAPILSAGFIVFTLVWATWLYWALNRHPVIIAVIAGWLLTLSVLSLWGFFAVFKTPPRILLAAGPPLVFSLLFPYTRPGKKLISRANIESLTLIHTGRILVELVFLWGLSAIGLVSDVVTFEGRNFDIIPGLTAPLVWYLYFRRKAISKPLLLVWNVTSLAILLFTISQALLSSPLPFQRFSFEQPTIAIFYFPFVWLPGCVAPIMIFSHITFFHQYQKM